MKTTIELPDDLMREMKIRAAVEGRKLKDVFADILRTGLMITGPTHLSSQSVQIETDPKTGLPTVIAVTDAPGSRMTPDQLSRLEQDSQYLEDLRRAGISF